MTPVLLAVDGDSIAHRAFYRDATAAAAGTWSLLLDTIDRIGPDAVVVGFDDDRNPSRRRAVYREYKAGRTTHPPELREQLHVAGCTLAAAGIRVVVPAALEADDVLASAAAAARAASWDCVVATADKDSYRLVDGHTDLLRMIDGGPSGWPRLDPAGLQRATGLHPWQYPDYTALAGDPSDNLPGITGIGPKTATTLLHALGTAEAVFAAVSIDATGRKQLLDAFPRGGRRVLNLLQSPDARPTYDRNRRIQTMIDTVDLGLHLGPGTGPGQLPLPAGRVAGALAAPEFAHVRPRAVRLLTTRRRPPRRTP